MMLDKRAPPVAMIAMPAKILLRLQLMVGSNRMSIPFALNHWRGCRVGVEETMRPVKRSADILR